MPLTALLAQNGYTDVNKRGLPFFDRKRHTN